MYILLYFSFLSINKFFLDSFTATSTYTRLVVLNRMQLGCIYVIVVMRIGLIMWLVDMVWSLTRLLYGYKTNKYINRCHFFSQFMFMWEGWDHVGSIIGLYSHWLQNATIDQSEWSISEIHVVVLWGDIWPGLVKTVTTTLGEAWVVLMLRSNAVNYSFSKVLAFPPAPILPSPI